MSLAHFLVQTAKLPVNRLGVSELKLYCRYLYTWPCMKNHIWGLKQL